MLSFLKQNATTSIISSLLFLVLGIILIINPQFVMNVIAYILGIVFIVLGALKIISYFTNKSISDGSSFELITGIVSIAVGIFVITCSGTISALFRIVIGIWIIYTGVLRLISSIRLKSVGVTIWPFLLLMSLLMIIAGIYITVNSGTLFMSLGVMILIYAIMDLVESITFYSNISKF